MRRRRFRLLDDIIIVAHLVDGRFCQFCRHFGVLLGNVYVLSVASRLRIGYNHLYAVNDRCCYVGWNWSGRCFWDDRRHMRDRCIGYDMRDRCIDC